MICRYDGTYAGLLTLCADLCTRPEPSVERIDRPPFPDSGLFDRAQEIMTDVAVAERMQASIRNRLGPRTLTNLRLGFLSERPGIELQLWRYLDLGWKVGKTLNSYLANTDVHAVLSWARRTSREAHRLKGLIRLRELTDGTYYGPVRAEANVLPLIADHFAERMDRPWLLHDVGRNLGVLGREGRFTLGAIETRGVPVMTSAEQDWQGLWQVFHRAMAIENRTNIALQQRFVPLKYREFLHEFDLPDTGPRANSRARSGSSGNYLAGSQVSRKISYLSNG